MILNTAKVEFISGAGGDVRVDARSRRIEQEMAPPEQRVAELSELLRNPVYRYLTALFGHPAEAEEIVQEAFLRLYQQLKSGQEIGDLRSWVFRVAHNLAINQQKGRRRLETMDAEAWERLCELRQDPAPNPEQRLLQMEKFERLHAAISRLSPQERQCLHLRAEGLRYREIAEILGLSVTTVAKSLYRAINQLKEGQF
jgi:RNA polymerase sigma-70 factor (ECF subfamily)